MIFINLGKKILRVFGYIVCAALLAVCILMIISALIFGSRDTVNVFGFNIYLVQGDAVSTAPKGSAVIVRKCSAFDLTKGNLTLYTRSGENDTPVLGYVENIETADGMYYVTVTANNTETRFADTQLIGRAEYSSIPLGKTISFIRTPWGVLCLAVMPCVVLIVYDILRATAERQPPPEVIPQVKNGETAFEDEDRQILNAARASGSKLSVNDDGKATLLRKQGTSRENASDVLFSYAARQHKTERPIIPLTDKKADIPNASKPSVKLPERPSSGYTSIININEPVTPKPSPEAKPKTPSNVAVGRYAHNASEAEPTKAASKEPTKAVPNGQRSAIGETTAELPNIPKRDTSDAFFAQTNTPTFNEETLKRYSSAAQSAPQLGTKREDRLGVAPGRTAKTARKRSTQIIAAKGMDELFSDDDDNRGRNRRAAGSDLINDIFAEAEKKK